MAKMTIKTTEKSPSKTRYDFRYGNFDLFNVYRPYHTVRYPVQCGYVWGDIMSPHPSYRTNAFIGGGTRYGVTTNACGHVTAPQKSPERLVGDPKGPKKVSHQNHMRAGVVETAARSLTSG